MLFPFLPCHVTKSRPLLVDSITDLVIEVLLTSFAFSNSHSLACPKMFNVYIYISPETRGRNKILHAHARAIFHMSPRALARGGHIFV